MNQPRNVDQLTFVATGHHRKALPTFAFHLNTIQRVIADFCTRVLNINFRDVLRVNEKRLVREKSFSLNFEIPFGCHNVKLTSPQHPRAEKQSATENRADNCYRDEHGIKTENESTPNRDWCRQDHEKQQGNPKAFSAKKIMRRHTDRCCL